MSFENAAGIFSPDGRLYPIEYAQHASDQGNTACISIHDGQIYVFYENKQTNKMQILDERIVSIGANMYLLFSGVKPDSYSLVERCGHRMFSNRLRCGEEITIDEMAEFIGTYKQKYTVEPYYRPIGLKTVLFGFNEEKPKIFVIEADGNFAEYDKCAVGYRSDKISESFDDLGEMSALSALLNVAQKDSKNIKGFKITKGNGLEKIQEETIKLFLDEKK